MSKIIAVDQDQVLADLFTPWVEAVNKNEKENVTHHDVKTWDICSYFKCGKKVYEYLTYELFRQLPVIEDSQSVMKKLMKEYEVYIVTSATSYPKTMLAKIEWLSDHFPFIPSSNIILCGNKKIIRADIMIDDGVHNLEHFDGRKILFDACHNKACNEFERVNSWKEVESKLL